MASKKQSKENKNKKLFKVISYSLIIVLTLGIASFVILSILINDKRRNPNEDNGLTNTQIINKELVQGLSQMDDSFRFRLTEDDINEMLINSLKEESVSKYLESAYVEKERTNFKWCFDLKVPLFTTRLVMNSHIESMESSYALLIDSMSVGKLNAWNLIKNNNYLSNEAFTTLFKNASLPLEAHLDKGYFSYNPKEFVGMFNLGEVTNEFFGLTENPEVFEVEKDTLGFKFNLEGVKWPEPQSSVGSYNLIEEIEAITSNESTYDSLTLNVDTPVLEVSDINFSRWLKDCYSKDLVLEEIESDLINTKVSAILKKVDVFFTNNEFVIKWTIKLGNIYLRVSENIGVASTTNSFKVTFHRPLEESQLQMILMDDFILKTSSLGYASYVEGNRSLTFDFSNVNMSLFVELRTSKRLDIVNNKLTFYLKKIV